MSAQTCIAEALQFAKTELSHISDSVGLDAEILLSFALGKDRSYLFAWPEQTLNDEQEIRFYALLKRRVAGEPIAYLTGQREFWSLNLQVSPDVLIPRPETELLVEHALHHLPEDQAFTLADLGTGSGAIALAIANERPLGRILATDRSKDALAIAMQNANQLGLSNVAFAEGDWLQAVPEGVELDMLVSNPPYIESGDPHLHQGDVRFEPRNALISGNDGLDDLWHIINQAPTFLKKQGWLLLEHGYNQGPAVRDQLRDRGFMQVETLKDLNGQDRISFGQIGIRM